MCTQLEQNEFKTMICDLIEHARAIGFKGTRDILLVALTVLNEECIFYDDAPEATEKAECSPIYGSDDNDLRNFQLLLSAQD